MNKYPSRASVVSSVLPHEEGKKFNTGGDSSMPHGGSPQGPQLHLKMLYNHRRVPSAASWRTVVGASEHDVAVLMSSSALPERKSSRVLFKFAGGPSARLRFVVSCVDNTKHNMIM